MFLIKTFVLLPVAAYVYTQQCAICPDNIDTLPLFYHCYVDDYTHCGYNDVAGIITSGPVCSYDNFDGSLITELSIGDCPSSVETTSSCTPRIIH